MVPVEVIVQENFLATTPSAIDHADQLHCPIATSTWESWFYQWLQVLEAELVPASTYELTLRLTNDTEIQSLNAQYRDQNKPTDVLAFAALEVDFPEIPLPMQQSVPLYLGDVVISVDTAYRQAQQQGHTLQTELAWLASHGLLHLLGWDHPNEESLTKMLNQQKMLLRIVELAV
ncbi:MAG: rRNA maturation RNase YbeY [Symploca sp. SIO2D2]|nr:rRNA maturation RNase YbeY [Symploca sp. SIO2D2]